MYAGPREAAVLGLDGSIVEGQAFRGRTAARMAERACDALNAAYEAGINEGRKR